MFLTIQAASKDMILDSPGVYVAIIMLR